MYLTKQILCQNQKCKYIKFLNRFAKIQKTSEKEDKFLIDVTSLLLSENLSKITVTPYKEDPKESF